MPSRALLLLAFASLLFLGARREAAGLTATATSEALEAMRQSSPPPQGGVFPDHWIDGVDCTEPEFQVHRYNEDLFIIRQSKCRTFEAPFLYLLFGEERALLMDTGAAPSLDVWSTVDAVVRAWVQAHNLPGIRLIVAHTHSHGDHFAGDSQFIGKPWVETVVGLGQTAVEQFWGFQNYPHDVPTLDLGNRVIDVIGTPGHQSASVTLYDRRTHLLLTGDLVYPGHLFIFSPTEWTDFTESAERLLRFATRHPIEWVLGCHIEMSATPGVPYAWGTPAHPDERELQLRPRALHEVYRATQYLGANPQCTIFDDFVVHPVYTCGIFWNG